MPSGSPVHSAACAVSRPATRAELTDRCGELLLHEVAEVGIQCGQETPVGIFAILQDSLVAGAAGISHIIAAQLPDDPVGRLDPAIHALVDLPVALQQFKALGEFPLGGDQSAVARQPGFVALGRQFVDTVGLRLRGMVPPEFDEGMRSVLNSGSSHNGVPSAVVGTMVQAVKSVPIPTTWSGRVPAAASAAGTALRRTSM